MKIKYTHDLRTQPAIVFIFKDLRKIIVENGSMLLNSMI
uniref:Uncharacterized protein n=1 Tax=Arundo donax TaxID=35708 RepID=A0A0A9D0D8_ARUDO